MPGGQYRLALCSTAGRSSPQVLLKEVVILLPFIMAGLVPPFLPFFVVALEAFALHMVHLTPNAILTLALFAHTCEMFVGCGHLWSSFAISSAFAGWQPSRRGPAPPSSPARWAGASFSGGERTSSR